MHSIFGEVLERKSEYSGHERQLCLKALVLVLCANICEIKNCVLLTNIIVTIVNKIMTFPCFFVNEAVNLADRASETLTCFCFRSSK